MNAFTDDVPLRCSSAFGELTKMPGLYLTPVQAARLLGRDAALSEKLMQALVRADFLYHASNDAFARRDQVVR